MDVNFIVEYVKPELLIIVVLCYVLGMFLKTSKVKDNLIPIILLLFAIFMSVLYLAVILETGFTAKVLVTGFIQGLLSAALAVYGNQIVKQLGQRK